MKFVLRRVELMPATLDEGVLYYSQKHNIAIHLCACGCGTKIKTPIHPAAWSIVDTTKGPTLYPSVGSWQERCKSHYFIDGGSVKWCSQWSDAEIVAGRHKEEQRREGYFASRMRKPLLQKIWLWIKKLFSRV